MRQTGKIYYKFKGMEMHPEPATVLEHSVDVILVSRNFDGKQLQFVSTKNGWLYKDSIDPVSLLHGTKFIFE